ncbi:MAG TPA: DUF3311 domain-containing protein [Candidatus Eisenbacteria bacterium]|nr:DUF3311 domain-containing protein [Candidatus Eisenbacteria bacterium]
MRPKPRHALALLPTLMILVGVPLLNGAHGTVLGLPPLLAWIVAAVVLTSVVMAVIRALDGHPAPDSAPPPEPGSDPRA